jgi:ketosteroid isomerase-like protein
VTQITHPNEKTVQRMLHALESGDSDALGECLDQNVVLHLPGRSWISGEYRGRDAVTAMAFTWHRALLGRPYRTDLQKSSRSGEHVALLTQVYAEARGKLFTWRANWLFFFTHGLIGAGWLFVSDVAAFDEFWAALKRAP